MQHDTTKTDVTTLDDVRAFIADHKWRFASTMAFNPHWYIVRPNYRREITRYPTAGKPAEERFVNIVLYIRKHGESRPFGKRYFVHIDVDGFTYWTMGDPIETTWIINRKKLPTLP